MTFLQWLDRHRACGEAQRFVTAVGGDARRAYTECERGEWLLFLFQALSDDLTAPGLPVAWKKRVRMWEKRARKVDSKAWPDGEAAAALAIRGAVRWRRVERLLRAAGVEL